MVSILVEEGTEDAHLGLLIRHALAAGGRLGLVAVLGEALVGGHPAGALRVGVSIVPSEYRSAYISKSERGIMVLATYSATRLLSSGRNVLRRLLVTHVGQITT